MSVLSFARRLSPAFGFLASLGAALEGVLVAGVES